MQKNRTRIAARFLLKRQEGSTVEVRHIVTEAIMTGLSGKVLGPPAIINQKFETSAGHHLNPEDDGRFFDVVTRKYLSRD